MINYIFYRLYKLAKIRNDDPESSAALALACLNLLYVFGILNIIDVFSKIEIMDYIYSLKKIGMFPFFIAFGVWHLWFFSSSKSEEMVKKYGKENKQDSFRGGVLVFSYIVGAFLFSILATIFKGHK